MEIQGTKESSIYMHSHKSVESKKNTAEVQNKFVSEVGSWVFNGHKPLSILIIGRFESYSKGVFISLVI